jgi:hypothetical protein
MVHNAELLAQKKQRTPVPAYSLVSLCPTMQNHTFSVNLPPLRPLLLLTLPPSRLAKLRPTGSRNKGTGSGGAFSSMVGAC